MVHVFGKKEKKKAATESTSKQSAPDPFVVLVIDSYSRSWHSCRVDAGNEGRFRRSTHEFWHRCESRTSRVERSHCIK